LYDESAGLPEEGIPPGMRWADVPETFGCPDYQVLNGVVAPGEVWSYRALLLPAKDVIEILRSQHRTMRVVL